MFLTFLNDFMTILHIVSLKHRLELHKEILSYVFETTGQLSTHFFAFISCKSQTDLAVTIKLFSAQCRRRKNGLIRQANTTSVSRTILQYENNVGCLTQRENWYSGQQDVLSHSRHAEPLTLHLPTVRAQSHCLTIMEDALNCWH